MQRPANTAPASGPTVAADSTPIYRSSRSRARAARLEVLDILEAQGVPRGQLPERLGISKTQLYRDLRERRYPHRRRRPDLTQALTDAHAETQALVRARMNERGLVDIDGVAEILKLTRVGAYGWLRARGVQPVETVPAAEHALGAVAGPPRGLYDPHQIAAEVRAWLQELVDDVWRGDPWRAARWYDRRFERTVMHGRLAPRLAAAKGKTVGRKLPDAQRESIRLKAEILFAERPGLSRAQLIDALVVYFKGVDKLKFEDGTRRPRRDPKYQAARRWVERRLPVDINPPAT